MSECVNSSVHFLSCFYQSASFINLQVSIIIFFLYLRRSGEDFPSRRPSGGSRHGGLTPLRQRKAVELCVMPPHTHPPGGIGLPQPSSTSHHLARPGESTENERPEKLSRRGENLCSAPTQLCSILFPSIVLLTAHERSNTACFDSC